MVVTGSWLRYLHRRRKKIEPTIDPPSLYEVVYHASNGVLEFVARSQPDAVIVISARYFPPDSLILLRRLGIFTGVVLTESPYDDVHQEKRAALADVVWTTERASVEPLRRINPNTFYLRHAYDAERHRPGLMDASDAPSHDVVFVGSGFKERIALLEGVDWNGIDLGLYGTWGNLGRRSTLRQYVREGSIQNDRTAALYRRAKVGLNLYRKSPEGRPVGESLNPRAYELAACGLFHASEHRPEVTETFGDLVPTFTTSAELESLTRRYLADESGRRTLADDLPSAVVNDSFDVRAAQIVEDIAFVRSPAREAVPV